MDAQFNAIFVCVDILTKLVRLVPCTTWGGELSAEEIARLFLDNIVWFYGIPKYIIHDLDQGFTSLFWKALFETLSSKLLYSSAYHLQTDRQTEQMHKVAEYILRTMATDVDAKLVGKLSFVEFVINSSVNALTGKTPFEVVYGQQVRNAIDQLDGLHRVEGAQQMVNKILKIIEEAKINLLQAQECYAKYYDKYHHPVEFAVNDKVLLAQKNLQLFGTQKFQQRFVGPLEITKRIGSQAYRLQLPKALQRFHNVFHISLLKPYVARGDGVEQPQPIILNGEPEQEVETILQHQHYLGVQQYLVKHIDYGQSEAIWLDESDLANLALQETEEII